MNARSKFILMYWRGDEESLEELTAYSYDQAYYLATQQIEEDAFISLEKSVCHCSAV